MPSLFWNILRGLVWAHDKAVIFKRFFSGDDHIVRNIAFVANIALVFVAAILLVRRLFWKKKNNMKGR